MDEALQRMQGMSVERSSSSTDESSDSFHDDAPTSDEEHSEDPQPPAAFNFLELKQKWAEREQLAERRKQYVRGVSRRVSCAHRKNLARNHEHLFDCALVIGLGYDALTRIYEPYVKSVYPPHVSHLSVVEMRCRSFATVAELKHDETWLMSP